jgi:GntR family histidine utilization transcriptional repressor
LGTGDLNNWQGVQAEVLRRIHARVWAPGDLIPTEQALAQEFGCARATVNRALQSLSDAGLLERRRKAGTRVALHPVRKATLDIPVIRLEIEDLGHKYRYKPLSCTEAEPDEALAQAMKTGPKDRFLRVKSVQYADDMPFVYEDRWINLSTIPKAAEADFTSVSANEWLVSNAPFSHGDIAFAAINADAEVARSLEVPRDAAIFVIERMTCDGARAITLVQQFFHVGYRMQTKL